MSIEQTSWHLTNELPAVPTTAVSIDSESRSTSTYLSFALIFFGALVATVNVVNIIYLQIFVLLPSLPEWMGYQIYNFLILDAFLVLGIIFMFSGAAIIYFEKSWPYGGVISLFGVFMTLTIFAIFLGGIGAFINLCSRPEPKRT
ncbi:MAG: hypothetical protein ACXADB_07465 [Candidatus Hermodarchaeia archaeon]